MEEGGDDQYGYENNQASPREHTQRASVGASCVRVFLTCSAGHQRRQRACLPDDLVVEQVRSTDVQVLIRMVSRKRFVFRTEIFFTALFTRRACGLLPQR